jgi:hypothetical protein
MAWRKLSADEIAQVVKAIRPFAGQRFDPITFVDDNECVSLLGKVDHALIEAGWRPPDPPMAQLLLALEIGIDAWVQRGATPRTKDAAQALVAVLNAVGLQAAYDERDDPMDVATVQVRVGKKPQQVR